MFSVIRLWIFIFIFNKLTVILVKNILKHGTGKYRRANQVIVNQELVYNMVNKRLQLI
jgi:hypothetical protein